MPTPTVIIFRSQLLPHSETFVRGQAEALRGFRPVYLGLERVNGLDLPMDRTMVMSQGLFGRWQAAAGFPGREVAGLRRLQPCLIHAHFEGGGILALPLAKALTVPLVVTCHGFDVTMSDEARWPNPIIRRWYRHRLGQLQRHGSAFIAVSEHIARAMRQRSYPTQKTLVHYIGVDTTVFTADPSVGREPLVTFIGRLVEKKGTRFLIEAMAQVQSLVPDAGLVVIGDGPERPTLEAWAHATLTKSQFLGVIPPREVRHWLNRSRVLCVPTVTAANGDSDGCPTVFAEAQAMGVPVVAFRTGGAPEAIVDGRTGWLVPEKDHHRLASAIVEALTDPAQWSRRSEAAVQHAKTRFDLATQTAQLEDLYRRLTEGSELTGGR